MNMRKSILFLLLSIITVSAFGHAGEVHTYMGTVTALHNDGSFALKKTDGTSIQIAVSNATTYLHANGARATRAELTTGKRAVVTISKDGKTATMIKLAAKK